MNHRVESQDFIRKGETLSVPMTRGERVTVSTLFAVVVLLRVAYVFRYRIDSDEPQHLHVVWGWTHGLLQYRDVFDNHMPLFHMLFAPLLAALGERPDALIPMRLAMIPLGILALWSTYAIGRELFTNRVGLWAAVFTGLLPSFFIYSGEFRTDVLWSTLWLLALAVLVKGHPTWMRSFLVGLLLGAALAVSMKTILLLASFGAALLATIALTAKGRSDSVFSDLSSSIAAGFVGFLSVPLAVTAFFIVQGAWEPFFYGTVVHNIVPGLGIWQTQPWRAILFPATLPLLWWGARTLVRRAPATSIGARRAAIFIMAGLYFLAVHTLWPMFTAQDHLPFYPLLVVFLTPLILAAPRTLTAQWEAIWSKRPLLGVLSPAVVVVAEIGFLLVTVPLWQDGTREEVTLLTDVLRLTRVDDPVIDLKGETVFRRRPYYYALEGVTKERIRRGLITDDIPERLIATRTCVAVPDSTGFPPRARAFLQENYLPVGHLRVAGRLLGSGISDGTNSLSFDVEIPARYAIVSETGAAAGWLDGSPYEGARFLARGRHKFRSSTVAGRIAVVWAQAVERGYIPFPVQRGAL